MKPRILVFSYGLSLDLGLLHSVVGGPEPCCDGASRLAGFTRSFDVCGHLPGLLPTASGTIVGALTKVTAEQLQRMDQWLLAYRRQRLPLQRLRGGSATAWVYRSRIKGSEPARPSLETLRALLLGSLKRGLPDEAIREIASWNPMEARRIIRSARPELLSTASR